MHRDFRALFIIYAIAIGGLVLTSSGCSFVKVPQGWVLSTGWSLEFHRMPFHASCEKPCVAGCETSCVPTCSADCAQSSTHAGEPTIAPAPVEPAPTLHKVEEGSLPEAGESSSLLNLLRRRGRLGICATCGKMGRFKEPQAAEQSTMPVVAKFHPVPAAPVFCPHPNAVTTRPVDFQSQPGQRPPGPNQKMPLSPQPEVIPPPPPNADAKAEHVPRELDVPPEPPDWVFTVPETRSEKMSETPSQSKRSSESLKRR